MKLKAICVLYVTISALCTDELEQCKSGQYLDTGSLRCTQCPTNSSMVPSSDDEQENIRRKLNRQKIVTEAVNGRDSSLGFRCVCDEDSIKLDSTHCRRCNSTEIVTTDGNACVPRRCVKDNNGRLACRKCPSDYIIVTQNFDGSPLKEVQCIKCARGFRPVQNRCTLCEACSCAKSQVAVRGICVPKTFLATRPKYVGSSLHQNEILDFIKFEYLCTVGDIYECRTLANKCIRSLYDTNLGGACRLWMLNLKTQTPIVVPDLELEKEETISLKGIQLPRNEKFIKLTLVAHTNNGGIMSLDDFSGDINKCFLRILTIDIGSNLLYHCNFNVTTTFNIYGDVNFAPYLKLNGGVVPVPIIVVKPGGERVEEGKWKSKEFRRYFLIHKSVPPVGKVTTILYLRSIILRIRIVREKPRSGNQTMKIFMETRYSVASQLDQMLKISLQVQHSLPNTGIMQILEIWGGILGAMAAVYTLIKWRSGCRRGAVPSVLAPILSGATADALYITSLIACLQVLAAEANVSGLVFPLSQIEEYTIKAMVCSAVALKLFKVVWMNFSQCRCDVFLLDWSEYIQPRKDSDSENSWRKTCVAQEWLKLQPERRVNPAVTASIALLMLHFMKPWQSSLAHSQGYNFAVGGLAWWTGYVLVATCHWSYHRFVEDCTKKLTGICRATGVSMLVFQEELYAHYIHGRNDGEGDVKSLSGPLAACRVLFSPQLRSVYKQLSSPSIGSIIDNTSRRALLTRFLAAFFERALDGLSWVASERSILERLLDVELTLRESGNTTSVLLYDPDGKEPSCTVMTWWGEEYNLAMFDAIVFNCAFLAGVDGLFSVLIVLITWQVMKYFRTVLGKRNFRMKTEINENWFN